MTAIAELVAAGEVAEDVTLAPLTNYRFGGPARWFAEPSDEAAVRRVVAAVRESPGGRDAPVLVLGRGSNLAVADSGFPGLVLRLGEGFARLDIDEGGEVAAGGAVWLEKLAARTVDAGRGGLEFFVGVPGTVGAAVLINAGCHGSETGDWLVAARVLDLITAVAEWRPAADLDLGYRTSNLGPDDLVVAARFRTVAQDPATGRDIMADLTRQRRESQPGLRLNAGSVFKNPPGERAWQLIDRCGLKGLRVGGVEVSTKHANFFVADPGTAAQDVYDLVWTVRRRVGEATDVWLEPEIRFAGSFRPHPDRDAGPPSPEARA